VAVTTSDDEGTGVKIFILSFFICFYGLVFEVLIHKITPKNSPKNHIKMVGMDFFHF